MNNDPISIVELTSHMNAFQNAYVQLLMSLNQQSQSSDSGLSNAKLKEYLKKIDDLELKNLKLREENEQLLDKVRQYEKQIQDLSGIKSSSDNILKVLQTVDANVNTVKQKLTAVPIPKVDKMVQTDAIEEFQELKYLPMMTKNIEGMEHQVHLNNIHGIFAWSPIELSDGRIASGGTNGSISICKIDYNTKKWTHDIAHNQAHKGVIQSVCELTDKRLVSCSLDRSIKIWQISQNSLTLVQTLEQESNVYEVITLTHKKFAACLHNKTVKIFSSETPYNELTKLMHEGFVFAILQLKNKEVLVSSVLSPNSIDFWNLKDYQKIHSIKGVCVKCPNHLIQLQNGFIALSDCSPPYPIVIINPLEFVIVRKIELPGYITGYSSLCTWGGCSLIYVYEGNFVQINIHDYTILYKSNMEKQLRGRCGMRAINKDSLLIIENKTQGFSIVKPI